MFLKIIIFFLKIIDDIMKDENFHIKFVDAFVNLVSRVLNLPVRFRSILRMLVKNKC